VELFGDIMNRDLERTIEFEFVRATENAALTSVHWMGRGKKEEADAAACDAIYGVFDLVDIRGEVSIGEGIKDNAPGIFLGDRLGTWRENAPRFDIALDPIDGTANLSKGLPNSISVMAAAYVPEGTASVIKNISSYYSIKLTYGPQVENWLKKTGVRQLTIDTPIDEILEIVARAKGKRINEVVVTVLDRPRNAFFVEQIRSAGSSLRMISDGDITAAVAPSLPETGVDLYLGIGGTPEGILTAAALKCLGGNIQMRVWHRDDEERKLLCQTMSDAELQQIYQVVDLIVFVI
jgi:fructose-1,6-bisphosphatase II